MIYFNYQILFNCIKCSIYDPRHLQISLQRFGHDSKTLLFFYVQVYSIHPFKLVNMTKESVDIPLL